MSDFFKHCSNIQCCDLKLLLHVSMQYSYGMVWLNITKLLIDQWWWFRIDTSMPPRIHVNCESLLRKNTDTSCSDILLLGLNKYLMQLFKEFIFRECSWSSQWNCFWFYKFSLMMYFYYIYNK